MWHGNGLLVIAVFKLCPCESDILSAVPRSVSSADLFPVRKALAFPTTLFIHLRSNMLYVVFGFSEATRSTLLSVFLDKTAASCRCSKKGANRTLL